MTSASPDKQALLAKLKPHGQQHLLHFWDELSDQGKTQLAQQIDRLDLPLIDSLFRGKVDQPDWADLSRRASPPQAIRLAERKQGGQLGISSQAARTRGVEALRAGEVGVLLTAGGQGTRLGYDHPKSTYPIGPLSSATLLQVHIEKILAASRRYNVNIPLYLMTSPATHDDTLEFLKQNNRFGLPESDLLVFCQGTMPAVDIETGHLLLAAKDSLFLSPDGHGGTVAALASSGAIDQIRSRAVRHLFYLQVDNPLVPICDPELIGFHLLANSELTSLAIAKQSPNDKLGNFATIDGRQHVIEYSDLPDDVAELRDDQGELKFWAGSIAIHIFDLELLRRSLHTTDALPFHIAHKKVPHITTEGTLVRPEEPNALKFEKFIFDLLPTAKHPIVVEYAEQDCFAPLKNAPGAEKDTAEYVQQMMLAQHRRWLLAAGAEITDNIKIEISPQFALDAQQVAQRIKPGQTFNESAYLIDR
ncbi:MAG: UDPGP type 1 family protein [Planctomycetes bacterium]|nr:UDPGP type 1 family protein [Planctomycetota bacterium]